MFFAPAIRHLVAAKETVKENSNRAPNSLFCVLVQHWLTSFHHFWHNHGSTFIAAVPCETGLHQDRPTWVTSKITQTTCPSHWIVVWAVSKNCNTWKRKPGSWVRNHELKRCEWNLQLTHESIFHGGWVLPWQAQFWACWRKMSFFHSKFIKNTRFAITFLSASVPATLQKMLSGKKLEQTGRNAQAPKLRVF